MNRSQIVIRQATFADVNCMSTLMSALAQKYIVHERSDIGAQTLLDSMRPAAIRDNSTAAIRYDLAELDGKIIGLVAVRNNSHLYSLFVAESHQHRGIARQLWQAALDRIREAADPDSITVNASHYAVPIYIRLGFVAESEKNGYMCQCESN